ncbi:MAG: S8 family serine peptidase [Patulibacter sp.]|nr:S8 family serine peptidase [Patulibacter sp.]
MSALLVVPAVPAVAAAATDPGAPTPASDGPRLTGRLLVTVRIADGTSTEVVDQQLDAVARRAGTRAVTPDGTRGDGTATAPVTAGDAAARERLIAKLRRDPSVVEIEPERQATVRRVPNEPVLLDQDPLAPPGIPAGWWAQRMRLPEAWALASGAKATVAVIDTGFDLAHPQLKPIVERSIEISASGDLPGSARTDEIGHGTHVASLACSAFDDAAGTVGAGGRCRLITIKSDLYDSSVAKAITRATELGADVISMSFGVDGAADAPRVIRDALQDAADEGVVLVAAGADAPTQEQGYPANVLQPTGSGAKLSRGLGLSVTAALSNGARAGFAGRGSQVSVAGFGAFATLGGPPGILGAFPAGRVAYEQPSGDGNAPVAVRTQLRGDNRYAYEAGTSMATPMVAGVAALVRHANPYLSAAEIVRVIKQSASRSGGWNADTGWGVVDAFAAVDRGRKLDRRAPVVKLRSRSRSVRSSRVSLAWTASDKSPKPQVGSGVRTVEVWRSVDGAKFRRVGSSTSGSLRVSVPKGRVRFAVRGVDRAGNRGKIASRTTVVLRRS